MARKPHPISHAIHGDRDPPVQRVMGVGDHRDAVGPADQAVLRIVAVGLDRARSPVRPADPVAASVIGVGVSVVREELVVRVRVVKPAEMAGEAVAGRPASCGPGSGRSDW